MRSKEDTNSVKELLLKVIGHLNYTVVTWSNIDQKQCIN
jgi:hypothetical protein